MSIETFKKCDVYGTRKEVRSVRVLVQVQAEKGDPIAMTTGSAALRKPGDWILTETPWLDIHLGAKGHKRLLSLIQRGLHPPGWNPKDDVAEAEAADPACAEGDSGPTSPCGVCEEAAP